jgi:hypothetical protein
VFQYLGYSHAWAALATIVLLMATFAWNFVDLFVVITGIALTERFRLLNRHLQTARGKVPSYTKMLSLSFILCSFCRMCIFREIQKVQFKEELDHRIYQGSLAVDRKTSLRPATPPVCAAFPRPVS